MQASHHKALQEHEKTVTDREKEADRKLKQAIEMHEVSYNATCCYIVTCRHTITDGYQDV